MKSVPSEIDALFVRYPMLCGFSVREATEVPDSCPRIGDGRDLFVADVGIAPTLSVEQHDEICAGIMLTLAELLAEQPQLGETLRGRTFARTLH